MKTRNDCEIACDCVKRANVFLHVDLCKEIFARKHTATHKPTSAQPVHMCHDDTHTPNNRLWSPLAYGLGGNNYYLWCLTHSSPPHPLSLSKKKSLKRFRYCDFTTFRCVKISVSSNCGAFSYVQISVSVDAAVITQCTFPIYLRCLFNFGETIDHRKYRK